MLLPHAIYVDGLCGQLAVVQMLYYQLASLMLNSMKPTEISPLPSITASGSSPNGLLYFFTSWYTQWMSQS